MDPGTNWSDAFRAGAGALIEAWRSHPADPDGPVAGQTIAEFAIHTWDLERATGQSHGIDEAAAEFAARWMRGALRPEYRGSAFGAEHAVPRMRSPGNDSSPSLAAIRSGRRRPDWPIGHPHARRG